MLHTRCNVLVLLALDGPIKGRGLSAGGNIHGRVIAIQQTVEGGWLLSTHIVNRQIPRYREEPGAERVLIVELMAALKHPNPRFLEKVLCQIMAPGEVEEVTKKTVLILLDETIEKVWVSTSKSTSDRSTLLHHRVLEIYDSRVHTTDTYGGGTRKDARWSKSIHLLSKTLIPERNVWRGFSADSGKIRVGRMAL